MGLHNNVYLTPPIPQEMVLNRRIPVLLILLLLSFPAASELLLQRGGRMPNEMIIESWKSAKVVVPGLTGSPIKLNEVPEDTKAHPIVIFLHGCNGINQDSIRWGEALRKLGYIAILLDSFAIPGRQSNCDGENKIRDAGGKAVEVKTLRANETRVAREKIRTLHWADDSNIFLMGHSEGGAGVVFTRATGFRAVISSGFKCGYYHPKTKRLPIRVDAKIPILFLYYKEDPWFDTDNCKNFIKTRNNVRVIELEGNNHETSSNDIARHEVAEFLRKNRRMN